MTPVIEHTSGSALLKKGVSERDQGYIESEERTWYALYVKAKHEFVVREGLNENGLEAYVPVAILTRRWKDRTKKVHFPLFPGYVFVCVKPCREEHYRALKTRGVVAFVSLEPGRPARVADEEIFALKAIAAGGMEYDVHPGLQKGSRIRIVHGPLRGATGILLKKNNHHLFVVNIELFGRSISVKVDAFDIESE